MIDKFCCCHNKFSLTKIKPSPEKKCGICLSDDVKLVNYPCDSCKEDCWFICKPCLDECKRRSKLCPVCRTQRIEIIIDSEDNEIPDSEKKNKLKCDTIICLQRVHLVLGCVSWTLGTILIGTIFPTMICISNCHGNENYACLVGGILSGIFFALLMGMFFQPKKIISDQVRFIVGLMGSIILVLTISINSFVGFNPVGFLWIIICLPICICISQKTVAPE